VALVGSSNFTAAGLGLLGPAGNVEVGFALGAPAGSREAQQLRSLIPLGEAIDVDEVEWIPDTDDESRQLEIPEGFLECLLEPGAEPALLLRLAPKQLPARWLIRSPDGAVLTHCEVWAAAARPADFSVVLVSGRTPFFVEVEWDSDEGVQHAGWPINVTEPGLLPPPDELRDLPVDALLRALGSTRPLHESLSAALRAARSGGADRDVELDPLQRYSAAGQLFQRTRRMSAALDGLRRRLERPASNIDALVWRLDGPFGPTAIAEGLIRDLGSAPGTLPGEASFLIAELALTLGRVNWSSTAKILGDGIVRPHAEKTLANVRELARRHVPVDRRLAAYVKSALSEASL
jgi:hypothetical protein